MAQNQHQLVIIGHQSYEEARKVILKFMNFGLPPGEYHDMIKYFRDEVSTSEIMKDDLLSESKREAWDAFDYFDLI